MILALLAQVAPSEWIGPGTQIGVLVFVLQWFMRTIVPQLRSIERSLDLNTRAIVLMAVAHEEVNVVTRAKLNECLAELDDKKAAQKRKSADRE